MRLLHGLARRAGGRTDPGKGVRFALRFAGLLEGDMGRRGRELIRRRYDWQPIAVDLVAVYKWILGRRPQPARVSM